MITCCKAIGCGIVLGLVLFLAAARVSEQFDVQLIHV